MFQDQSHKSILDNVFGAKKEDKKDGGNHDSILSNVFGAPKAKTPPVQWRPSWGASLRGFKSPETDVAFTKRQADFYDWDLDGAPLEALRDADLRRCLNEIQS